MNEITESMCQTLREDAEWLLDGAGFPLLSERVPPDQIWIPIRTFMELFQYPLIWRMQRARERRPRFATMALPKWVKP